MVLQSCNIGLVKHQRGQRIHVYSRNFLRLAFDVLCGLTGGETT